MAQNITSSVKEMVDTANKEITTLSVDEGARASRQ